MTTKEALINTMLDAADHDAKARLVMFDCAQLLKDEHGVDYKDLTTLLMSANPDISKVSTVRTYISHVRALPRSERPDDPDGKITFEMMRTLSPLARKDKDTAYQLLHDYCEAVYQHDGIYHDNDADPSSIIEAATSTFKDRVKAMRGNDDGNKKPLLTYPTEFFAVPKRNVENAWQALTDGISDEALHVLPELVSLSDSTKVDYIKIIFGAFQEVDDAA